MNGKGHVKLAFHFSSSPSIFKTCSFSRRVKNKLYLYFIIVVFHFVKINVYFRLLGKLQMFYKQRLKQKIGMCFGNNLAAFLLAYIQNCR